MPSIGTFGSAKFHRLVEEMAGLKIVVEHLGGHCLEADIDYDAFARVMALARYPNTYIKLPGLGELLPRPAVFEGLPFKGQSSRRVEMAYDAFGPQRMMWGSDYPPSGNREGYANALRLPMERIETLGDEDKSWVFGKTALSIWEFK